MSVWEEECERMADPLDEAAARNDAHNAACIKTAQLACRPEQERNADGSWPITDCEDCGIPIPEERLNMGKIRCVPCQSALEPWRPGRGKI